MMKLAVAVLAAGALVVPGRFARADAAPELKSEPTATSLSLGGSLAAAGVVALGVSTENHLVTGAGVVSALIAPSAGEIYAGEAVTVGMGIRAVALGTGVGGYLMLLDCIEMGGLCRYGALSVALITTGIVGWATGAVYDVATTGKAVDRHNRRVQLQLAPMVATPSGPAAGLSLGGSF